MSKVIDLQEFTGVNKGAYPREVSRMRIFESRPTEEPFGDSFGGSLPLLPRWFVGFLHLHVLSLPPSLSPYLAHGKERD